jgi:uncharacterized repeat protein (TIGR01451 family)
MVVINSYAEYAAAQEPVVENMSISEKSLEAFGLSGNSIEALSNSFDLRVNKTANVSSVTSGETVTFTISIQNLGPDPAPFVTFFDDYPAVMTNVVYMFSTAVISTESETPGKPYWMFTNPIAVSHTVWATVTGQLTSSTYTTARNEATVSALGELTPANNTSSASVIINNGGSTSTIIYLPIILKYPPVAVLVYSDNFSSSSSGWYSGYSDSNHCYSTYDGSRYRINIDSSGRTCWRPAPSGANRTYGSFQVEAYISEGNSNAAYGIYSNGDGGSIQYLLKIWPNTSSCSSNGSWQFLKSGSSKGGGTTTCNAAIRHGLNITNTLKITHQTNGNIISYINDTPVFTYADSSQLTSGEGTGVYVTSGNTNNVIKFDNFQVYTLPQ